jgi:hypothetical protein
MKVFIFNNNYNSRYSKIDSRRFVFKGYTDHWDEYSYNWKSYAGLYNYSMKRI